MAKVVLDYLTTTAYLFLAIAILLIFNLKKRRQKNRFVKQHLQFIYTILVFYVLALFASTLYISIPQTSNVELLPSDRTEIPPPEILLTYPSSARTGETVEIVLKAVNAHFITDINISLIDYRNSKTIDIASMTVEPGVNAVKSFAWTMPNENLKVEVKAMHPDTLSELRTKITIEKAGKDVAALMLIGVITITPILAMAIVRR